MSHQASGVRSAPDAEITDTTVVIEEGKDYVLKDYEHLPYERDDILGKGSSAVVERVLDIRTNEVYARKTIKIIGKRDRKDKERFFNNEVEITQSLKGHLHIIHLFATYTARYELGLLLRPAADGNSLEHYLSRYWDYTEELDAPNAEVEIMTRSLEQAFGCLANGLAYIHSKGIRHRDIKPQNILIHKHAVIIADFGSSKNTMHLGENTTEGAVDFQTRRYSAPEVLNREKRSFDADVYSLGCVFIEILSALSQVIEYDLRAEYADIMDDLHGLIDLAAISPHLENLKGIIKSMTLQNRIQRYDIGMVDQDVRKHAALCCATCEKLEYWAGIKPASTVSNWTWVANQNRYYCWILNEHDDKIGHKWSGIPHIKTAYPGPITASAPKPSTAVLQSPVHYAKAKAKAREQVPDIPEIPAASKVTELSSEIDDLPRLPEAPNASYNSANSEEDAEDDSEEESLYCLQEKCAGPVLARKSSPGDSAYGSSPVFRSGITQSATEYWTYDAQYQRYRHYVYDFPRQTWAFTKWMPPGFHPPQLSPANGTMSHSQSASPSFATQQYENERTRSDSFLSYGQAVISATTQGQAAYTASCNTTPQMQHGWTAPRARGSQAYGGMRDSRTTGINTKLMDSFFSVRDRDFFREGKVFAVLMYKPPGPASSTSKVSPGVTIYDASKPHDSMKNGPVHTKTRSFIVVRAKREFCYAVPIFSYSGKGTMKDGVRPSEHGIAYSWGQKAQLLPGEDRITKPPVVVVMAKDVENLPVASRIYYGIMHPIKYGAKVKELGYVPQTDIEKFMDNWRAEDGDDC